MGFLVPGLKKSLNYNTQEFRVTSGMNKTYNYEAHGVISNVPSFLCIHLHPDMCFFSHEHLDRIETKHSNQSTHTVSGQINELIFSFVQSKGQSIR